MNIQKYQKKINYLKYNFINKKNKKKMFLNQRISNV
jgi:hypothetical protein